MVTHLPHKQETDGSSPSPVTNKVGSNPSFLFDQQIKAVDVGQYRECPVFPFSRKKQGVKYQTIASRGFPVIILNIETGVEVANRESRKDIR